MVSPIAASPYPSRHDFTTMSESVHVNFSRLVVLTKSIQKYNSISNIVQAVRGILVRDLANSCTSMKFGTLVVFDMLSPNQPRTKVNF
jgi:hypothetical protein